jgi:hypothetical protein
MSYNTVLEFKARAFPSGSFNGLVDSVIQTQLDVAASEIDSALRAHHSLPMNTGSYSSELASIYEAEAVMTSYRLMMHVGFKPNIDGSQDNPLETRYLEITSPDNGWLMKLSTGKIIFPGASDATPSVKERRSKMFGKSGRTTRQYTSDGKEYIGF